MANLLDCPPELLIRIFAHLPLTSLRGLLTTSKTLNNLISSSVLLQYLLHLQSSAHSLYPSRPVYSLIDQLKVLTDSEKRWQDWDYTTYNRLEIEHRPSGIYDLTSGIFILGEGSALGRLTVGLRWVDLRLGGDLVWNRFDLQTPIVDLGVNVLEWDLIAVLSMRIGNPGFCQLDLNLLQLSTSKDSVATHHPKAKRPLIPIMQYPFEDGHCSIAAEIVGPYLALLIVFPGNRDSPDRLWVFEWQTGNIKFARSSRWMTYNSLAFLDEETLILPNLRDHAIELCSFTKKAAWTPATVSPSGDNGVVMLKTSADCLPLSTNRILKLPPTREGMSILRMACRGEPNPFATDSIPRPVESGPSFRPDPGSSIVIFNLLVGSVQHRSISFVVNRESLLQLLESDELDRNSTYEQEVDDPTPDELEENPFLTNPDYTVADNRGPPSFVPWSKWGTRTVRWFMTDDIPTRWITTSCGYRWATIAEDLPSPIYIRDFNPWRIKQVKAKLGSAETYETERTIVTVARPGSPTLEEESIFLEPVSSDLEYLEVKTKKAYRYSSVFMDENWILGIVLDSHGQDMKAVDIYSLSTVP